MLHAVLCSVGFRVADRLVMEQLMVEVLEELADRELLPNEAAQVMKLAGMRQHIGPTSTLQTQMPP